MWEYLESKGLSIVHVLYKFSQDGILWLLLDNGYGFSPLLEFPHYILMFLVLILFLC